MDYEIIFAVFGLSIAAGGLLLTLNMIFQNPLWEKDNDYFFPTRLYKLTNLNIFGCIVCSILLFATNYLYCIFRIIIWIFTVGRKK